MIVTVSGRSGLRKAYRSVLSAIGSWLMRGASRWLDATARNVADTVNAATVNGSSHLFTGSPSRTTGALLFPLLRTESRVGFNAVGCEANGRRRPDIDCRSATANRLEVRQSRPSRRVPGYREAWQRMR